MDPPLSETKQSDLSSLDDVKGWFSNLATAFISLGSDAPTQVNQIDALVPRVWEFLGRLQSYRNKLVPISKLPPEILSRIMFQYALETDTLFNLKWTKLMWVCHHWRDVSLSVQELWSYIDVDPWHWRGQGSWLQTIQRQLKKAPTSPLTVRLSLRDRTMWTLSLFTDAPLLDPVRLRSLHITGDAKQMLSWFAGIASSIHPLLESLEVQSPSSMKDLSDGEVVRLPDTFLDGRAPRLWSLKTKDVELNWNLIHDLKEMCVSGTHGSTFLDVISALRRSPALEVLEVTVPEGGELYPAVELPQLRSIHLFGNVQNCSSLLTVISIPGTASLRIHPQGLRSGVDARNILVPIRKHVRSQMAPVLRSLVIKSPGDHLYFLLSAYADTLPRTYFELDNGTNFLLNSHPANTRHFGQILTRVLKALPTEFVTHLDMRFAETFAVRSWKIALSHLPSLRVVVVRMETPAASHLLDAMIKDFDGYAHNSGYQKLEHIHLDGTHIRRAYPADAQAVQIEKGRQALALLFELLTRLKESGTPLSILELTEAWDVVDGPTKKRLHKLLAEKLIYDGIVYDPDWRRKAYEIRLRTAAKMREIGMDASDPVMSDSSDSSDSS